MDANQGGTPVSFCCTFRCPSTGTLCDPFAYFDMGALKSAFLRSLPGGEATLEALGPATSADGHPAVRVAMAALDVAGMQELRTAVLSGDLGVALTRRGCVSNPALWR